MRMIFREKQEIFRELKERVKADPEYSVKLREYIDFLKSELAARYDKATNMDEVARLQGQRMALDDIYNAVGRSTT